MPQGSRARLATALVAMGFAVLGAPPGWAHDTEPVGPLRISFGWGDEPPFTGVKNFVEVEVADAAGRAIANLRGDLRAEVSFGDQRVELPLLPDEEPGRFRAALIPTRPGTYAFRITGNVQDRAIDVGATCSDQTFECVSDATEVQFPAKDPSVSQLADRLARELPRASDKANGAKQLAIAALVVALLALAAAIGFGLRNARKRG